MILKEFLKNETVNFSDRNGPPLTILGQKSSFQKLKISSKNKMYARIIKNGAFESSKIYIASL